jgi:hypothetical protein
MTTDGQITTHDTYDFVAYTVGVVSASACTSLTDAEATARMNAEHPTGISSRWQVASDVTFADGTPNPYPCRENPETHRHVIFHC